MRTAFGLLIALTLCGCGRMSATCDATDQVRLSIEGRTFAVPVNLRPAILDGSGGVPDLPSNVHRDAYGRWAYCQRSSEPAAVAQSFSLYPRDALPGIDFIIVGRKIRFWNSPGDGWPTREEAGFEVVTTKGGVRVFSPTGGVRRTPVLGNCSPPGEAPYQRCRISFITQAGASVTFDMAGGHPLADWPAIIGRVETFVGALEVAGGS